MERILSINEYYIKNTNEKDLFKSLKNYCEIFKKKIDAKHESKLVSSMHFLKNKAKKLEDIYKNTKYITNDNIEILEEDLKLLDNKAREIIKRFLFNYEKLNEINKDMLEKIIKDLIKDNNTNFKGVGQPLRIALTGSKFGPGIYDIIQSLEKSEVIKRLKIFK